MHILMHTMTDIDRSSVLNDIQRIINDKTNGNAHLKVKTDCGILKTSLTRLGFPTHD